MELHIIENKESKILQKENGNSGSRKKKKKIIFKRHVT